MTEKTNISRNFSQELASAHSVVKSGNFAPALKKIIQRLVNFSAPDGPHAEHAAALEEWRRESIFFHKTALMGMHVTRQAVGQQDGVLAATGDCTPGPTSNCDKLTDETKQKLAALTLFLYLHVQRHFSKGHTISVLALPPQFKDWPSNAFRYANGATILSLLAEAATLDDLLLPTKLREQLTDAVFYAAAYIEKAWAVLDTEVATKKLMKWFADEETTAEQITLAREQLRTGARKALTVLRSKKLVLTDHPQLRDAISGTQDGKLKVSEAFVFKKGDPIVTIYIQEGFFKENPVINGTRNFARIIIHEVIHREMLTHDYHYASNGIKPGKSRLPFSKAIENSDSWAFCFLDLAGQLVEFEIARAQIN